MGAALQARLRQAATLCAEVEEGRRDAETVKAITTDLAAVTARCLDGRPPSTLSHVTYALTALEIVVRFGTDARRSLRRFFAGYCARLIAAAASPAGIDSPCPDLTLVSIPTFDMLLRTWSSLAAVRTAVWDHWPMLLQMTALAPRVLGPLLRRLLRLMVPIAPSPDAAAELLRGLLDLPLLAGVLAGRRSGRDVESDAARAAANILCRDESGLPFNLWDPASPTSPGFSSLASLTSDCPDAHEAALLVPSLVHTACASDLPLATYLELASTCDASLRNLPAEPHYADAVRAAVARTTALFAGRAASAGPNQLAAMVAITTTLVASPSVAADDNLVLAAVSACADQLHRCQAEPFVVAFGDAAELAAYEALSQLTNSRRGRRPPPALAGSLVGPAKFLSCVVSSLTRLLLACVSAPPETAHAPTIQALHGTTGRLLLRILTAAARLPPPLVSHTAEWTAVLLSPWPTLQQHLASSSSADGGEATLTVATEVILAEALGEMK
jgi:hypothetical protein